MLKKLLIVGVAACALVMAPTAQAGSNTDRATGGGQILVGSRGGAGDTIAFTAQGSQAAAKGQVQYVDREATTQTVFHGRVTCLVVSGNMAKLAGVWDKGKGTFELLVTDNGEGAAAPDDVIAISQTNDPTCASDDDDDDGETALARGNAQVYDATP